MRRNNLEPPDSRRAFRRNADISCEIVTRRADIPFTGRIMDISPYGAGVLSRHSLPVGETVVVKLHPNSPNAEHLSLLAELVHRGAALLGREHDNEVKLGLEFLNVSERRREQLEAMFYGLPRSRMSAFARA